MSRARKKNKELCDHCRGPITDPDTLGCCELFGGCGAMHWMRDDVDGYWNLCNQCWSKVIPACCAKCKTEEVTTMLGCLSCKPACRDCGIRYCEKCSPNNKQNGQCEWCFRGEPPPVFKSNIPDPKEEAREEVADNDANGNLSLSFPNLNPPSPAETLTERTEYQISPNSQRDSQRGGRSSSSSSSRGSVIEKKEQKEQKEKGYSQPKTSPDSPAETLTQNSTNSQRNRNKNRLSSSSSRLRSSSSSRSSDAVLDNEKKEKGSNQTPPAVDKENEQRQNIPVAGAACASNLSTDQLHSVHSELSPHLALAIDSSAISGSSGPNGSSGSSETSGKKRKSPEKTISKIPEHAEIIDLSMSD